MRSTEESEGSLSSLYPTQLKKPLFLANCCSYGFGNSLVVQL